MIPAVCRCMVDSNTGPLRVLHTVRTRDPAAGGFITYLDSLRLALRDRAVRLRVQGVFPRSTSWRVASLRWPRRFHGLLARRLQNTDVLHVHGVFGWHALLSFAAARAARQPFVLTVHGHLHREALRERFVSKRLYLALAGRAMLEQASAVLVTTPAEAAVVRRRAQRARVVEIAPGLRVPDKPPVETDRVRRADETLKVLYLGRLHPHKGLHLLVRAAAMIRSGGSDVALTVAGTGRTGYRRSVQRLADKLGLADRLRFVGLVDAERRAGLFRSADVFVLPSRSENFGFAVAEAMAAGVPVIVSDQVGLAHLVEQEQCGRVVPVTDVNALKQALGRYFDPITRRHEGRRAHATARTAFSLPRMGTALERVYRHAAASPPPT